MNMHADKSQENNKQSVGHAEAQKQSGGASTVQFVDNRPEAIAQRKLQEMVNSSPQVSQLKAVQNIANTSPRVSQLKAVQRMINNSPQVRQAAQLQAMADNYVSQQQNPIQQKAGPETPAKANHTGLPDTLKSGIENLSGYSMDDVKVHYNSSKPAQLQAHAYAQGTDIHVAGGQEKYLPHEAWHVVQQKQGRVKPTLQAKGIAINDNSALETEADVMGSKALQLKTLQDRIHHGVSIQQTFIPKSIATTDNTPIQRYIYMDNTGNLQPENGVFPIGVTMTYSNGHWYYLTSANTWVLYDPAAFAPVATPTAAPSTTLEAPSESTTTSERASATTDSASSSMSTLTSAPTTAIEAASKPKKRKRATMVGASSSTSTPTSAPATASKAASKRKKKRRKIATETEWENVENLAALAKGTRLDRDRKVKDAQGQGITVEAGWIAWNHTRKFVIFKDPEKEFNDVGGHISISRKRGASTHLHGRSRETVGTSVNASKWKSFQAGRRKGK